MRYLSLYSAFAGEEDLFYMPSYSVSKEIGLNFYILIIIEI